MQFEFLTSSFFGFFNFNKMLRTYQLKIHIETDRESLNLKKDSEQLKKQVKFDKSRVFRGELADSKEQIQAEVSWLQILVDLVDCL